MFLSYEEYLKQNYPEYYDMLYGKRKVDFDAVIEQFNKFSYVCPVCCDKFEPDSKIECYGHGDYELVVWLKCKCGIHTKRFAIYDEDSFDKFFAFIEKFKIKEDIE